jgi:hypothetical protein
MAVEFYNRSEKAQWGFPCNQRSDGSLWAGKGYQCSLAGQFGADIANDISEALAEGRGNRNGRFWVNLATRKVTMYVGASEDNDVDRVSF